MIASNNTNEYSFHIIMENPKIEAYAAGQFFSCRRPSQFSPATLNVYSALGAPSWHQAEIIVVW